MKIMERINLEVVWSVLRTLLVAGGPVATLLIALNFPAVEVGTYLGIGLAIVGIASVAVPGLIGALNRTDAAKVAAVAALPFEAKVAAVAQMPDQALVTAVGKMPDVKVEVGSNAPGGAKAVAANDAMPNVTSKKPVGESK